ncbi:LPS export ABC transporter periplasmic protein LptC [Psychrobacter sp. HD31]|uniref:LPS export ABC transporter periplasmic protein LptC n=1 Tax=Psychrobacter sp. HD31 TaxID=3112003 RepID=UPI003DA436C4
MKTKPLFIIALIIAVAAFWLFKNNVEISSPISIENPEIDSEATSIEAVQTNEQGETEYQLNAEKLTHNSVTNLDEISGLSMDWTPAANKNYQLTSGKASLNQETGEMLLTGGFKLVGNALDDNTKIIVIGTELTGNTKQKVLKSTQPVKVVQGDNSFEAQSMTANLEIGDYDFNNISISFMPVERKDKSLF